MAFSSSQTLSVAPKNKPIVSLFGQKAVKNGPTSLQMNFNTSSVCTPGQSNLQPDHNKYGFSSKQITHSKSNVVL